MDRVVVIGPGAIGGAVAGAVVESGGSVTVAARRPFDELLSVTAHPFEARTDLAEYSNPPEPQEVVLQTFCGT